MAKAKDLRDQSLPELEAAYDDLRKELFKLKNEARLAKKLDKPHLLRTKRKDIARVLTVIHEKQSASKHAAM